MDAPRLLHIRLSTERLTTWHVEKVHSCKTCLQGANPVFVGPKGLRETLAIFFFVAFWEGSDEK